MARQERDTKRRGKKGRKRERGKRKEGKGKERRDKIPYRYFFSLTALCISRDRKKREYIRAD